MELCRKAGRKQQNSKGRQGEPNQPTWQIVGGGGIWEGRCPFALGTGIHLHSGTIERRSSPEHRRNQPLTVLLYRSVKCL